MIKFYSIPLHENIMEPEDYAKAWLEDCLQKCGLDLKVEDYILRIEETEAGYKRAVFEFMEMKK